MYDDFVYCDVTIDDWRGPYGAEWLRICRFDADGRWSHKIYTMTVKLQVNFQIFQVSSANYT